MSTFQLFWWRAHSVEYAKNEQIYARRSEDMPNASMIIMPEGPTEPDSAVPGWILLLTEYVSKWWFVFVFVFGIPGNLMSLLITLKKQNRRISTCVYMAALALVDSVVLINVALHKTLIIHGWPGEAIKSSIPFLR